MHLWAPAVELRILHLRTHSVLQLTVSSGGFDHFFVFVFCFVMLCTLKIRACGFAAVSYSGVRGVPSLSYLSLHSIWMLIIMLRALPLSQVGNAAMVGAWE